MEVDSCPKSLTPTVMKAPTFDMIGKKLWYGALFGVLLKRNRDIACSISSNSSKGSKQVATYQVIPIPLKVFRTLTHIQEILV